MRLTNLLTTVALGLALTLTLSLSSGFQAEAYAQQKPEKVPLVETNGNIESKKFPFIYLDKTPIRVDNNTLIIDSMGIKRSFQTIPTPCEATLKLLPSETEDPPTAVEIRIHPTLPQ